MTTENIQQAEPTGPSAAKAPDGSRRGYLKDMDLPPEIAREVQDYCRQAGYRKKDWPGVVEDAKLQYFFGHQWVGYVPTPQGLFIVCVGALESEEFGAALDSLPREERQKVVLYRPGAYDEQTSSSHAELS